MLKKLILLLPLFISFSGNYAMDLTNPDLQKKLAEQKQKKAVQKAEKVVLNPLYKPTKKETEKKENEPIVVTNPLHRQISNTHKIALWKSEKERIEKEQEQIRKQQKKVRKPQISLALEDKQVEKAKPEYRRSLSDPNLKQGLTFSSAIAQHKKTKQKKQSEELEEPKQDSFAVYYAPKAEKSLAVLHKKIQEDLRKAVKEADHLAIKAALLAKADPNESHALIQLLEQLGKCKSEEQKEAIFNSVKTIINDTKVDLDWTIENKKHETIYSLAKNYGAGSLFAYLQGQMPIEVKLFEGIRQENIEMIKEALEKGANPNMCDARGNTAIMQVIDRMKYYTTRDGSDKYEKECRKVNAMAMIIAEKSKDNLDWNKRNNNNDRAWELLAKYQYDNPLLFQYLSVKMPDPEEEARKNKMVEAVDLQGNTRLVSQEEAKQWGIERIKQGNKEDAEREKLEAVGVYALEYEGVRDQKIQELQQQVEELKQKPMSVLVKNTISDKNEKIKNLREVEQTAIKSSYYYKALVKLAKEAQTLEDITQRQVAAKRLMSVKGYLKTYLATMTEEQKREVGPELLHQWQAFLA